MLGISLTLPSEFSLVEFMYAGLELEGSVDVGESFLREYWGPGDFAGYPSIISVGAQGNNSAFENPVYFLPTGDINLESANQWVFDGSILGFGPLLGLCGNATNLIIREHRG